MRELLSSFSLSDAVRQLWGLVGVLVFIGGLLSLSRNLAPVLSWLARRAPATVLLLGGAVIFVGSLIPPTSYPQLSWLGVPGVVWMIVGLVILLVLILLVSPWVVRKPVAESEVTESPRIPEDEPMPEGWGNAFVVRDNTSLREGTGLRETFFSEGDEIYGYWLSGLVSLELAEIDQPISLRTVILPDPTRPWIQDIARSLDEDADTLINRIREATDKLKGIGVPRVLWHGEWPYTGVALTFGNPSREDGWVNVNPNLTRPDPKRHGPIFRLKKKGNEASFNSLWESFGRLEAGSRPAPERPVLRVADAKVQAATYRESPEGPPTAESAFVHVLIENAGSVQLRECGVRVLRIGSPGGREYSFSPALKLHRSGGEHPQTVTVFPHTTEPFDLVRAMEGGKAFELFSHDPIPFALPSDFFDELGRYEFLLEVTGEVTPASRQIVGIEWNGNWDQMEPTLDEGDHGA